MQLFENVRSPAGNAAARKNARELVAGYAEIGKHRRGVEVDVGVDLAIGMLFS
jgi:hypothetical protein